MTPARKQKLMFLVLIGVGVGAAVLLGLKALDKGTAYFFSPTEVLAQKAPKDRPFRIGGMVATGSFKKAGDGLNVSFIVTDTDKSVPVSFKGMLPDLFREGQGVVAQGSLSDNGVFVASEVLAKHDEKYMPPEAADAIKKAQENKAKAGSPNSDTYSRYNQSM